VGVAAGILNVVAGGGSFLTLPTLIFLGLPHDVANGTNRLAILIQTSGATASFQRAGELPARLVAGLGLAAVLGAGLGSALALRVGEATFLRTLATVMVAFTLLQFLSHGKGPAAEKPTPERAGPALFAGFLLVGFYGGFVQAGVGFLSLAMTSRAGLGLVPGNAIKVACILLFSVVSLAVFTSAGVVDWRTGLTLGAGTFVGALLGVRITLRAGERALRFVVAATTCAFAVALWLRA